MALSVCMLAACPFPASHGTPGSIREMAEAVAGLGHEVHLVTYHFGENIPVKGPRIHRIAPCTREATVVVGPTIRKPLYNAQMIFKTLGVVRTYRPDLIHAHGYEAALIAWVCKTLTGLPVLYSGHNTMADELASYRFIRPHWLANTLARVLDAWVPRLADRCLPHSSNLARFFRERGLEGRTESVINFGIDLVGLDEGDGAAVRRRYALGSGPVVVYTGVLDSFQRLDLLLEAMAGVVRVEPAAKLLIVATVPQPVYLAQVRGRAEDLGIGAHVVTSDVQPLAAVRDFLAAADVAVVPRPRAPGFPIKLLNYFAARKPCVLFASSASRGLVHRENAFLVECDTGAALGQAIVEVLRDAALSRHLADNGYQFVHAHHDRQMIARQVCDAYARTLAQKSRSRVERGMQKATHSCSAYS